MFIFHVNVSLNRLPDCSWRRRPGRPHIKWSDQLRAPPTTHLEIYGGVRFTVVPVVEWHDGPCWHHDCDDDMMMMIMMSIRLITRSYRFCLVCLSSCPSGPGYLSGAFCPPPLLLPTHTTHTYPLAGGGAVRSRLELILVLIVCTAIHTDSSYFLS